VRLRAAAADIRVALRRLWLALTHVVTTSLALTHGRHVWGHSLALTHLLSFLGTSALTHHSLALTHFRYVDRPIGRAGVYRVPVEQSCFVI
jgi:hypothetical protein